jgi:hypothetical protein
MGMKFGMHFLATLLPGVAQSAWAQNACPINADQHPTSSSQELNVPEYAGYRQRVKGDYVVIEYSADTNKTSWTDYWRKNDFLSQNDNGQTIEQNGSFLPVIYTKEKIAVRVCGLHFTDVLTVTTSQSGLPEQGADIRGAAPVTPATSLSSTLDMLQSGTTIGNHAGQRGRGGADAG